jgi:histidine triad (HIT) family protein
LLAGGEDASFVYRDDEVSAFMDIQPINPGHVLVVPNTHVERLRDLRPVLGECIFRMGQAIGAALLRSEIPCEGVNFFVADGPVAGQEVAHFHLHVIPRVPGDGFGFRFPEGYGRLPRPELDRLAVRLRDQL